MSEHAESAAERLAAALDGYLAVVAADAIPAGLEPRNEPTVEIVLRAAWDYLPEPVASVVYDHGFAPVTLDSRSPDHLGCLAVRR